MVHQAVTSSAACGKWRQIIGARILPADRGTSTATTWRYPLTPRAGPQRRAERRANCRPEQLLFPRGPRTGTQVPRLPPQRALRAAAGGGPRRCLECGDRLSPRRATETRAFDVSAPPIAAGGHLAYGRARWGLDAAVPPALRCAMHAGARARGRRPEVSYRMIRPPGAAARRCPGHAPRADPPGQFCGPGAREPARTGLKRRGRTAEGRPPQGPPARWTLRRCPRTILARIGVLAFCGPAARARLSAASFDRPDPPRAMAQTPKTHPFFVTQLLIPDMLFCPLHDLASASIGFRGRHGGRVVVDH